jgi:DNA polymerase epsilon subunit 1
MPPRRAGQPFRRMGKSGNTSYGPRKPKTVDASSLRSTEATSQTEKLEATRLANRIDESMGFVRFDAGKKRVGWLVNMHSTTVEDESVPGGKAGVDFYFIGEDGDTFKATLEYDPYFLLAVKKGREQEVEEYCRRAYEGLIKGIKRVEKEDLSMPNHLTGYRRTLLQLSFANVNDLLAVRKAVSPVVEKNKKNTNAMDTYAEVAK